MKVFQKINIKSHPHYFFNDMINIKNLDPNLLSIDKISFKSIDAVSYITLVLITLDILTM